MKIPLNRDVGRCSAEGSALFGINYKELGLISVPDKSSEIALRDVVMLPGGHGLNLEIVCGLTL